MLIAYNLDPGRLFCVIHIIPRLTNFLTARHISRQNDNEETVLRLLAKKGRANLMRLLLRQEWIDPNPQDEKGHTPLLWAARNDQAIQVRILLMHQSVDPNSRNLEGWIPLSLAAPMDMKQ